VEIRLNPEKCKTHGKLTSAAEDATLPSEAPVLARALFGGLKDMAILNI
jgi:hypothetical protein